jgi:tRNA pseudouridine55 synthase
MRSREDFLSGQVLLIDKPLEWTSFQVVNKLRWAIRQEFDIKKIKVGHAGTLDPLASGLLILCTGKFTKRIDTFQAQEKTYTGSFTLGATRPSYDMETEIDSEYPIDHISEADLERVRLSFCGEIDQVPPIFSALKKDGKKLYELAREGKTTEIPSRKITIFEFKLTSVDLPVVRFEVKCSKGTYIRSLAHDFGKALSSGAYLSELRRTEIGDFKVADAESIEEFLKFEN